jgi:hypothetical protein
MQHLKLDGGPLYTSCICSGSFWACTITLFATSLLPYRIKLVCLLVPFTSSSYFMARSLPLGWRPSLAFSCQGIIGRKKLLLLFYSARRSVSLDLGRFSLPCQSFPAGSGLICHNFYRQKKKVFFSVSNTFMQLGFELE